jgi:hypothetical protein
VTSSNAANRIRQKNADVPGISVSPPSELMVSAPIYRFHSTARERAAVRAPFINLLHSHHHNPHQPGAFEGKTQCDDLDRNQSRK